LSLRASSSWLRMERDRIRLSIFVCRMFLFILCE
jgi:hypothetical protein